MSLLPLTKVVSRLAPLLIDNVDTDVITPIKRVLEGREATIHFAFEPLRFDESGALRPECSLNDPAYAGAEILLAGANFGCGSSRETAVWAIAGMGFRVVIAPSFGDIFHSNCFKNGVLPVVAGPAAMMVLRRALEARQTISVDLERQEIEALSQCWRFVVPALRRESLLLGLDDLGLIQKRAAAVEAFEAGDRKQRPWVYALGSSGATNQSPAFGSPA